MSVRPGLAWVPAKMRNSIRCPTNASALCNISIIVKVALADTLTVAGSPGWWRPSPAEARILAAVPVLDLLGAEVGERTSYVFMVSATSDAIRRPDSPLLSALSPVE
jgi:hypothetical protein